MVEHWTDTHDLCLKVVTAVAHAINLTPRPGWIRGDQAIDPKVLQDMERLRIENQDLREQLSAVGNGEVRFDPLFIGPDEFVDVRCQERKPGPDRPHMFNSRIKLEDIFVASYEALLSCPTEAQLSFMLGKMVAESTGKYREGTAVSLIGPSMQRLRIQLEALGLIDIIGDSSGGTGMASRRWEASEKGKRFALLKLAMRKADSISDSSGT